MTMIPLRATLLYWLHRALLGDCEEELDSFTNFLQIDSPPVSLLRRCEPPISSLTSSIWQKVPLQKKQNAEDVLYVSAMPQRFLSINGLIPFWTPLKSLKEPSTEISQQMVDQLKRFQFYSIDSERDHKDDAHTLLFQLWREFQIETQRPGWIAFRLCDRGISLWLDQLPRLLCDDNFMPSSGRSPSADVASFSTATSTASAMSSSWEPLLWQVQYTYARCCTLLRLWEQNQPELANPHITAVNHPAFDLTTLLGMTPAISAMLIQALIETADDLFWIPYQWPSQQYFLLLRRAAQLCQVFDAFGAARLSGLGRLRQSYSSAAEVAVAGEFQAGFHLTMATKNILKVLLCQYLGAEAPAEI